MRCGEHIDAQVVLNALPQTPLNRTSSSTINYTVGSSNESTGGRRLVWKFAQLLITYYVISEAHAKFQVLGHLGTFSKLWVELSICTSKHIETEDQGLERTFVDLITFDDC